MLSTFRAILNDESIRIFFKKCDNFRVKIRDVALGPFNL